MKKKISAVLNITSKSKKENVAEMFDTNESEFPRVPEYDVFVSEKSKFTCAICRKTFSDKNCLKKHIQRIHGVEPGPLLQNGDTVKNKAAPFKCRVCETEFAYKRNLKRHLIKYHSQGLEEDEGGNCFCNVEGCKFRSFFISALRTHLSEQHKVHIEIENKEFSSKKEFDQWKEEEEKTNVCLFIKEAGKHTLINGDQRLIYQCHRSGHYSGHGFGKRSFRVKGTCKLGKRCTAGIELTVKAKCDMHEVVYYKTHIWHQPDVAHVNLSASERAYLANKLQEGASIASILESVKANKCEEGTNFCQRIQLLKRKDLVNIENTFRLNNTERHVKKQHKKGEKIDGNKIKKNLDDYGEVVSWVIESASSENDYFTVKKLQSEKCVHQCGVICVLCDTCLHMYSCTCHDYLLFSTMCQHIHSVSLSLCSSIKCKKSTLKCGADVTKRRSKEKNEEKDDAQPTNGSMLSAVDHKDSDIINFFNRDLELQREQELQEERNKLREKIHILGDLCSLKLNHMNENALHMLMKAIDSAIDIVNPPPAMDSQPSITSSTVVTSTVPTITANSNDLFHHIQPQPTSIEQNNGMLTPNQQCADIHDHSSVKEGASNLITVSTLADRKPDILQQYCSTTPAVRNKKRKMDESTIPPTVASTVPFYRSHAFDKRPAVYENNLNDNTLINDNYTSFDCNGMSWQTPALPASNSSFVGKWWAT